MGAGTLARPAKFSGASRPMLPDGRWKARARRQAIEALIEQAIEALDAMDGDPDLEEEQDCCAAADDDLRFRWSDGATGSDDDHEDDAEVLA